MTNRSECALQYSLQSTSVWYLKTDQYKTCPSIDAPQKKNSIMVTSTVAREIWLSNIGCAGQSKGYGRRRIRTPTNQAFLAVLVKRVWAQRHYLRPAANETRSS